MNKVDDTVPDVVFVTGTDTGVGKTIVSAALAVTLAQRPDRPVAVHKLVQAGAESPTSGDAAQIAVLTWSGGDIPCTEGVRLLAPMAPKAAARLEGLRLPPISDHVATVERLSTGSRTIVEGSGGLLVHLDEDNNTFADVVALLNDQNPGLSIGVVVVTRSSLGTLNHTALTLEALQHRDIPILGLVIGSWPSSPDVVDRTNVGELSAMAPILGAVPEGAGALNAERFVRLAPSWLPGVFA